MSSHFPEASHPITLTNSFRYVSLSSLLEMCPLLESMASTTALGWLWHTKVGLQPSKALFSICNHACRVSVFSEHGKKSYI